jgi:hypothetical protein
VRGDRLEATSLRHAWIQIDESLRAGLVYAAWPASDVNWLPTLGCLGHPVAFSSTSFVVKRRKRPAR